MSADNISGNERVFDLTKGSDCIDCNFHCPSTELGERYPNWKYEDIYYVLSRRGPVCVDPNAPYQYEAKPRKGLQRLTLNLRRLCVYWSNKIKQEE